MLEYYMYQGGAKPYGVITEGNVILVDGQVDFIVYTMYTKPYRSKDSMRYSI